MRKKKTYPFFLLKFSDKNNENDVNSTLPFRQFSSNPFEILDINWDWLILSLKKKSVHLKKYFIEKMPSINEKRPSVTLEDRIKAVMMRQQGKSFATIGRELNRAKSCIKRIVDR